MEALSVVKITFCLRRLPHLSPQEFRRHWYEIHAPLVRKHQKALRIVRYIQFHSDLGPLTEKLRAFRHSPEPYDGVAEIWYESREALKALGKDPSSPDLTPHRKLRLGDPAAVAVEQTKDGTPVLQVRQPEPAGEHPEPIAAAGAVGRVRLGRFGHDDEPLPRGRPREFDRDDLAARRSAIREEEEPLALRTL